MPILNLRMCESLEDIGDRYDKRRLLYGVSNLRGYPSDDSIDEMIRRNRAREEIAIRAAMMSPKDLEAMRKRALESLSD